MSYSAVDWRDEIVSITGQYRNTPGDAPPPQLVEGMLYVETGGTFDPKTYHPAAPAIGLGQVVEAGMDYQAFIGDPVMKARYPNGPNLYDGYQNLEVMIYGLNMRQELGGALSDWYMTAASYLGGATTEGFNTAADANGTTGKLYAARVIGYVANTFGGEIAEGIDALQPGAVTMPAGVFPETLHDATPEEANQLGFDPNAQSWNYGNSAQQPNPASKDEIYDGVRFTEQGTGKPIWDRVTDSVAGSVLNAIGALLGEVGAVLPRIGLFIAGAAILAVGLYAARGTVL